MQEDKLSSDCCEVECSDSRSCPKFSPSMSIQRYSKVAEILKSSDVVLRKVVDFGCSDMSFFRYLKSTPNLREISLVDLDINVLKNNLHRAGPLTSEFLIRRFDPLEVLVYKGSVAEPDQRLLHYDAVSCIELVEHLTDDILEKFPQTIFGFIKPKLAVITTPNADFNILFPNMKGFRHWDHKFEWTRKQFIQWCQQVVAMFPSYSFEIIGVGEGPSGSEDLGCCSQIAVFKLNESIQTNCQASDEHIQANTPYILLQSYDYPYRGLEETMTNEILYKVTYLSSRFIEESETDVVLIPVDELFKVVGSSRCELNNEQLFSKSLLSSGLNIISKDGKKFVQHCLEKNESDDEFDHESSYCEL
ncbi:hypothetical protein CHUAL_008805 [Chamberlinius hualienensis]